VRHSGIESEVPVKRFAPVAAVLLALAACGDDGADSTMTTVAADAGRVAVGPPITVAEALTASADRPDLVQGFLFVRADGTMVLADLALESFPPQPGGATITVVGFSVEGMAGLQAGPAGLDPVQWVDGQVEILGTVAGGVLAYYDNPTA
jgi:hypothetical protein